jgi:cobalamin biosynthesis protein CobD/CbiB
VQSFEMCSCVQHKKLQCLFPSARVDSLVDYRCCRLAVVLLTLSDPIYHILLGEKKAVLVGASGHYLSHKAVGLINKFYP